MYGVVSHMLYGVVSHMLYVWGCIAHVVWCCIAHLQCSQFIGIISLWLCLGISSAFPV